MTDADPPGTHDSHRSQSRSASRTSGPGTEAVVSISRGAPGYRCPLILTNTLLRIKLPPHPQQQLYDEQQRRQQQLAGDGGGGGGELPMVLRSLHSAPIGHQLPGASDDDSLVHGRAQLRHAGSTSTLPSLQPASSLPDPRAPRAPRGARAAGPAKARRLSVVQTIAGHLKGARRHRESSLSALSKSFHDLFERGWPIDLAHQRGVRHLLQVGGGGVKPWEGCVCLGRGGISAGAEPWEV